VTQQIFSARAPEGCLFFCADWGLKISVKSALFGQKSQLLNKNAVFGT
jgi:hypothetical protein